MAIQCIPINPVARNQRPLTMNAMQSVARNRFPLTAGQLGRGRNSVEQIRPEGLRRRYATSP